ncbi:MAG: hypothetical protein WAM85_02440 [Terracidiphilus sp.]
MMSLDNTLWLSGILTEAVVVGLLIYRRVWRLLPIFCVYCAWDLLSNASGFISKQFFPASYTITTYLLQSAVDSALQFGVLVELAWSVLRPIRTSLPRGSLPAVGGMVVVLGAIIWPFAAVPGLARFSTEVGVLVHMLQTVSILRILFFLVLAGCSQWLSIGWRDRELQVATGLGIYSLVSLGASMLHTHQAMGPQYAYLNQFVVASFLCCLLYWVFSFAQKEAERRAFTPQMQNMLLAVAGVARSDRAALADSIHETRRPGKR